MQLSRSISTLCLVAAVGLVVVGCGQSEDDSSEAAIQQQIAQARKEGAREARQRDKIESLQSRVKRLEREGRPVAEGQPRDAEVDSTAGSSVLRAFHTPNVSCELRANGAICTVVSTAETFAFEDGEAAYVESGSRVPEDVGALAAWDSTVSTGSITCTIPPLEEPRGISCVDNETGHGFEASRVPARQRTY